MHFNGLQWISLNFNGYQWITMDFTEFQPPHGPSLRELGLALLPTFVSPAALGGGCDPPACLRSAPAEPARKRSAGRAGGSMFFYHYKLKTDPLIAGNCLLIAGNPGRKDHLNRSFLPKLSGQLREEGPLQWILPPAKITTFHGITLPDPPPRSRKGVQKEAKGGQRED